MGRRMDILRMLVHNPRKVKGHIIFILPDLDPFESKCDERVGWGVTTACCEPHQRQPSPSEVVQWSNHRVMEWLRAVDLAEYAPNLRGSGVHGGLIVSTRVSLSFTATVSSSSLASQA